MAGYTEHRAYSPTFDCEVARLSMYDTNGSEFFMLVPVEEGKRFRERRQTALDAIYVAIQTGRLPGEVRAQ